MGQGLNDFGAMMSGAISSIRQQVSDTLDDAKDKTEDFINGLQQWADQEIKNAAKRIARPLIRAAMKTQYWLVKTTKQAKLAMDGAQFLSSMKAARSCLQTGLVGNAGTAAMQQIDKIKAQAKFDPGVNSIHA